MTSVWLTSLSESISMIPETRDMKMTRLPDSLDERFTPLHNPAFLDISPKSKDLCFLWTSTPSKNLTSTIAHVEQVASTDCFLQKTRVQEKIQYLFNQHAEKLFANLEEVFFQTIAVKLSDKTTLKSNTDGTVNQLNWSLFVNSNPKVSKQHLNQFNSCETSSQTATADQTIFCREFKSLPIEGNSHAILKVFLSLHRQCVIGAFETILEILKEIIRSIYLVFYAQIYIAGTILVRLKVSLWKRCFQEKAINFQCTPEPVIFSMEQQQMNINNFAQGPEGNGFVEGEDGFFEGQEEDDFIGMGGDGDDLMRRPIPNFFREDEEEGMDEDEEAFFGVRFGVNGNGADAEHRRVPSLNDLPAVGNFYDDERCGHQLAEEFPNAIIMDPEVLEAFVAFPEPVAPPIPVDQLPVEEIFLDPEAANAA